MMHDELPPPLDEMRAKKQKWGQVGGQKYLSTLNYTPLSC